VRRSSSTIVADLGDALDELRTTVRREFPDELAAELGLSGPTAV